MFEQSLVLPTPTNKRWTFAASLILQMAGLSLLVLLPLIYTEQLSQVLVKASILPPGVPPAPPPPKVPVVEVAQEARPRTPRVFTALAVVPSTRSLRPPDELIQDAFADPVPAAAACNSCVVGSIGGSGVPFLGDGRIVDLPPGPAPVKHIEKQVEQSKPLRIGGDVLAAKIIRRVVPVYPALAKQARVSGTVKLIGVISKDGTIQQLQVVSGHPLLVSSALEAVRQWVYRPTHLNGEPVEVVAPIDVNFTLNN
jgi:protein TonB